MEASKHEPEIQNCLFAIATSYVKLLSENSESDTLNVKSYFEELYKFRRTLDANPVIHMMFFVLYLYFVRQKSYKAQSIKLLTEKAEKHFKQFSKRLDPGFNLNLNLWFLYLVVLFFIYI